MKFGYINNNIEYIANHLEKSLNIKLEDNRGIEPYDDEEGDFTYFGDMCGLSISSLIDHGYSAYPRKGLKEGYPIIVSCNVVKGNTFEDKQRKAELIKSALLQKDGVEVIDYEIYGD
ncbi:hypothetical protein RCC89_03790 [Cytophagaceae bacterium ABcell3]|nr:hypothetical protein RCC89_03790 [Cytophagaceae bacterium ABcell3]